LTEWLETSQVAVGSQLCYLREVRLRPHGGPSSLRV